MFRISSELVKENDKLRKRNIDLKEHVIILEESNKSFKIEKAKIRNPRETCETFVSLKKEVVDFHETLGKLTKEKKSLTLSYQVKGLC